MLSVNRFLVVSLVLVISACGDGGSQQTGGGSGSSGGGAATTGGGAATVGGGSAATGGGDGSSGGGAAAIGGGDGSTGGGAATTGGGDGSGGGGDGVVGGGDGSTGGGTTATGGGDGSTGGGTGEEDAGAPDAGVHCAIDGGVTCEDLNNCPALTNDCLTPTCDSSCCGSTPAAPGTACVTNGGQMCDGQGHCVGCLGPNDCRGPSCSSGSFSPAESCVNNQCQPSTPQMCPLECDAAFGCVQCTSDAQCAPASCTGNTFTASATCSNGYCQSGALNSCSGATPLCNAAAGCVQCNAPSDCGAAGGSCNGNVFTPTWDCAGNQCGGGAPQTCSGATPACSASLGCVACNGNADCGPGSYCSNHACLPTLAAGAECQGNGAQCSSGRCGPSGNGGTHCCTTSCGTGVCGATDCSDTGACIYPQSSVAPVGLQTPGDCQKLVCNGSGGVTSSDDVTDLPVSNSECLVNPACDASGGPTTPRFDPAPTGTSCSGFGNGEHVCGDTSNPFIAGMCVQCNVDADCLVFAPAGTLVCNTSSGTCQ